MTFFARLGDVSLPSLIDRVRSSHAEDILGALSLDGNSYRHPSFLTHFAALISSKAQTTGFRSLLSARATVLGERQFLRRVQMFAPVYLSDACVNACRYCGFSRANEFGRVTLSPTQVSAEVDRLVERGFEEVLLVSGEHPTESSPEYLAACLEACARHPHLRVSLEVGPLDTHEYVPLVAAGAKGLVIYQETYDRQRYADVHLKGPKTNYRYRLECPERALKAGFGRIGIGALLGLHPWREEALMLAAHAAYLLNLSPDLELSFSIPRLRPARGGFEPLNPVDDDELKQLVCALRIAFPQAGIVLSTRETAELRDELIPLGITRMSAQVSTHPGGYASAPLEPNDQFEVADGRSLKEVSERLCELGYEPQCQHEGGS